MATSSEIEARLRAENPTITVTEDGVDHIYTAGDPAYEATIARWVQGELDQQVLAAQAAADKQLRHQVRVALAMLDDGTATLAQMRQILAGLIRVIIQRGIIDTGD